MKAAATLTQTFLLGLVGFLSITGARAQDNSDTEPPTVAEARQYATEVRSGKIPQLIRTKIGAVKTQPAVLNSSETVTLKARLFYLDTTGPKLVWRKLKGKDVEIEVPVGKLAGAATTDGNGWATFSFPVTNKTKRSVQVRWAARFQGDSKCKASNPDGLGRFLVNP